MRRRTLERALLAANVLAIASSIVLALIAAPSAAAKPPLEIWGLGPDDQVEVDGTPVTVKGGTTARTFSGDPTAVNAPVLRELSVGKHELVLKRPGCASRTISIEMLGTLKRTIVFAPASTAHCAIPAPPPRAP